MIGAPYIQIGFTVSLIPFGESVIWRQLDLFRVAETGGGIV